MSSILKALKKLEEEKSLLEESKELNVSREILKQPADNRKMIKWLWLLGSSAAIIIILLTFALIRKPAPTEVVKFKEAPLASQPAALPSPAKNQPAAKQLDGSVKGSSPAAPPLANEPKQKPSRQLPVQADIPSIRAERVELPGSATPSTEPKKSEPVAKTPPERTVVNGAAAFTLSGIAWNKDSADRMAIINGQPTATGASVDGVFVEEILPDRVKLSRSGRIFEILIGKSTNPD
ncbi:MAG: hypothetical protein CVU66_01515 [Deltaproteobacteria bacterium HGW-Deltaproteobacteria-23]|nr:MAG: hypothetical protein CVU66_01515 [Deltaproteobacteria bacterium HGW-Deltaproteobacteria-23]